MGKTNIAWSEMSWNPVTGCSKVSPGCAHCYAEALSKRFGRSFEVTLHPERLGIPLRWKPSRIFVCSMADLFHEDVPDDFIARVWNTMASATTECSHRRFADHDEECWTGEPHIFQVLTKRPVRMAHFLDDDWDSGLNRTMEYWPGDAVLSVMREVGNWPLPNVWVGTSIENDRWVGRANALRDTPAAVRFISAEPLLGPLPSLDLTGIDWLIIGGESGANARPCNVDWIRSLVAQGNAAGVATFVKQVGTRPVSDYKVSRDHWLDTVADKKGGDPSEWPADLKIQNWPAGF